MKRNTIRTSLDIPRTLHRQIHEAASRKGCSARQLMLSAIEQAIAPPQRRKVRLNLDKPLVPSTGKPISLTEEEIYELAFPFGNP
ncbi:MAG TPA: hypothetical protein VGV35_03580 [Bryobacteraceae bacterium]|nr:hypothetical protein [Bryobacteraceae bacterium]